MNKSMIDVTCKNSHTTIGVIDGTFDASRVYIANCSECSETIQIKGNVGALVEDWEIPDGSVALTMVAQDA